MSLRRLTVRVGRELGMTLEVTNPSNAPIKIEEALAHRPGRARSHAGPQHGQHAAWVAATGSHWRQDLDHEGTLRSVATITLLGYYTAEPTR